MTENDSFAFAESAEAEFMYQYESMAPNAVKAQLGISTTRIGGGVVLSMRNDVTGYWRKAVSFGVIEPVTSALIDEVLEFYRAESSPGAVIQISPPAYRATGSSWPPNAIFARRTRGSNSCAGSKASAPRFGPNSVSAP
jgi:hypothetical protein